MLSVFLFRRISQLNAPPFFTRVILCIAVGRTTDHPLSQQAADRPKLRTQAGFGATQNANQNQSDADAAAELASSAAYFKAQAARQHLQLSQLLRPACFPSAPLTDAVEAVKLGLAVRLPGAAQMVADRETAAGVIQVRRICLSRMMAVHSKRCLNSKLLSKRKTKFFIWVDYHGFFIYRSSISCRSIMYPALIGF